MPKKSAQPMPGRAVEPMTLRRRSAPSGHEGVAARELAARGASLDVHDAGDRDMGRAGAPPIRVSDERASRIPLPATVSAVRRRARAVRSRCAPAGAAVPVIVACERYRRG